MLALLPSSATAAPTHELSGVVRSMPSGESIEYAMVLAKCDCLPGPRETMTGADGRYAFEDLPAGQYRVTVISSEHVEIRDVRLRDGQGLRVDVDLSASIGSPEGFGHHRTRARRRRVNSPASATARLRIHVQRIKESDAFYYEGSRSHLTVRRGTRVWLEAPHPVQAMTVRVPPGRYRISRDAHVCAGTCRNLEGPVERCSTSRRLRSDELTEVDLRIRHTKRCAIRNRREDSTAPDSVTVTRIQRGRAGPWVLAVTVPGLPNSDPPRVALLELPGPVESVTLSLSRASSATVETFGIDRLACAPDIPWCRGSSVDALQFLRASTSSVLACRSELSAGDSTRRVLHDVEGGNCTPAPPPANSSLHSAALQD